MGILYTLLVLAALCVSVRSRDRDAIFMAGAIFLGSALTMVVFLLIRRDWAHFNGVIIVIDLAILIFFGVIAMKARYRWPMIVCALQFIVTASHIAAMIGDTPATRVLGVAQGLWAYIQCFAIIFGVFHNSKKTIAGPRSIETS